MPADAGHQKRALRAEMRERRRTHTSHERSTAAAGLTRNLVELTRSSGARSVSCYLSTPDEPETRDYLRWTIENGVRALLPISRNDGLLDWTVWDGSEEEIGLFGLPEPVGELLPPSAINDVHLILVPAAAVDERGVRMGWGRGYFDKTLGSMEKGPPVYAVVFDSEVTDEVPRERHDQPVNGAVTPLRVLRFASPSRS